MSGCPVPPCEPGRNDDVCNLSGAPSEPGLKNARAHLPHRGEDSVAVLSIEIYVEALIRRIEGTDSPPRFGDNR